MFQKKLARAFDLSRQVIYRNAIHLMSQAVLLQVFENITREIIRKMKEKISKMKASFCGETANDRCKAVIIS